MNTDSNSAPAQRPKAGTSEAKFAARLLLVGTIISNVFEDDFLFVIASLLNLGAGFLLIKAARLESIEQQIAPGVTTFANGLKLIGSTTGVGVSILLLWALLIEISLKQPSAIRGEATFAGATGAFRV